MFDLKTAVIFVDYINEIIAPNGKLAGKGYADFAARHGSIAQAIRLLCKARDAKALCIFVRLGFSSGYAELPERSPLFGAAKKYNALLLGTWGTEFYEGLTPNENDIVIEKNRVSAFYGTKLDLVLRLHGISTIVVAGVATDLAVESAVRDAHDRDFDVVVAQDACIAASDEDHNHSLIPLAKIARVVTVDEIEF